MGMSVLLLQTLLYAPGPFFAFPWKPVVNALAGESYPIAYRHFRRDHRDPANLAMHFLCLILQLVSNFALLTLVDDALELTMPLPAAVAPAASALGVTVLRPLAASTALLWTLYLLAASNPSPVLVRLLAGGLVMWAYVTAPAWAALGPAVESVAVVVFIWIMLLMVGTLQAGTLAIAWAFWVGALGPAQHTSLAGSLAENAAAVIAGVIAVQLIASSKLKVPEMPVVFGTLLCRLAYIALGHSHAVMIFWGSAFVTPLLQRTSHLVTGEEATLIILNKTNNTRNDDENAKKIKYEWGHVTFFPVLALHSVHESLFGSPERKGAAASKAKKTK